MLLAGRPLGRLYERWHMNLIQRMQTVAEELPGLERFGMLGLSGGFQIQFGLCRVSRRRLSMVLSPLS